MQRTFATTLVLTAVALTALGCRPPRYGYDDRYGADRSRYDRDQGHGHDHQRDRDGDVQNGRLDVNRASVRDLGRLPGLSAADAQRIAAHRPYERTSDLVDRRIIGARKFDRIEDLVYTGRLRNDRDARPDHDVRRDPRPYDRNEDRYQDRRFFDDR